MINKLLSRLSLADTQEYKILVGSAVEWINSHTSLTINGESNVEELPNSALLFILKYLEVVSQNKAIASETAQGLTQSFNTSQTLSMSLYELASELLGDYLTSTVTVKAGQTGWSYGC